MLNKTTIQNYSIKEIEKIFSDITNNVTLETHKTRDLKKLMFDQLKNQTDLNITCNHSRYDTFTFKLKYFNLEFSICAKNTGKIAQITKLRSKDIKKANGIKLKIMYAHINPMINKIELDKSITNDYILKFDENRRSSLNVNFQHHVKDKNSKLSYIFSEEYFNTNIDANESLQEKLKKELIIRGCQPIFMFSMFNREWVLNPNPYKKLMKKFGYTYDDDNIKEFVYDRNKHFFDNIINNIIEKMYE